MLLIPMNMPEACWQKACFDLLTGGRYLCVCLQVLFVDNSDTVRARVAAGVFERIADWYAQLQKPFLSVRVRRSAIELACLAVSFISMLRKTIYTLWLSGFVDCTVQERIWACPSAGDCRRGCGVGREQPVHSGCALGPGCAAGDPAKDFCAAAGGV